MEELNDIRYVCVNKKGNTQIKIDLFKLDTFTVATLCTKLCVGLPGSYMVIYNSIKRGSLT